LGAQLLAPHVVVLPTICRNTRDIIVRSVSVVSNHKNGFQNWSEEGIRTGT